MSIQWRFVCVYKRYKRFITAVEQNQKGVMWLKISSKLFAEDYDIYICHTYFPTCDSKVFKVTDFFPTN